MENTGFDKILYEACNAGKVMCGVSAGAVCWFKSCNSDTLNGFESVECLNFINAHLTPHTDELGRYKSTKEQLKENGLVGIMLSNCAAIEIIDNKYRIIISDSIGHNIEKAYALKAYWINDEYKEEKILISNEYQNINNLLDKK